MKMFIKCLAIAVFLLYIPADLRGTEFEKQLVGTYKSRVKDNSFIILHLKADKLAIIQSTFWFGHSSKDRTTNAYYAEWVFKSGEVFVTYNGIEQVLSYEEKLDLKEYGISRSIPGLITSKRNQNDGLLDSVKLWRQDELRKILSDGETVIRPIKGGGSSYFLNLTTFIIFLLLVSAVLGRKKPLIGGIAGALVLPILHFLFKEADAILLIILFFVGFFLGLLAGYIGSFIRSVFKGKGHNIGPSYMSGFGGGRSARPGGIVMSDEERRNIRRK